MADDVFLRRVPRDGWSEAFLTVRPAGPVQGPEDARALFDAYADALAEHSICVLQEKIYGLVGQAEEVVEARRAALAARDLDPERPFTYLEGAPCAGGILAGVQVIGAIHAGGDGRCETLYEEGRPVGRSFEARSGRSVFLAGVSGHAPEGAPDVTEQAQRMFARAQARLRAVGLDAQDIVRTWIYMPRLLDWYGEFNRVRTACFEALGVLPAEGERFLPASTGIQGRRREGEECFMDVLAVRGASTARPARAMRNVRQNEAFEYGSSFSRGVRVGLGEAPTLYVSGTASIDPAGRTIYHGDHQGQVLETLLDVHALLRTEGARLRDLCQATVYCKTPQDHATFEQILDMTGLADLPFLCVHADVCRDELLFEMDAVAVA